MSGPSAAAAAACWAAARSSGVAVAYGAAPLDPRCAIVGARREVPTIQRHVCLSAAAAAQRVAGPEQGQGGEGEAAQRGVAMQAATAAGAPQGG